MSEQTWSHETPGQPGWYWCQWSGFDPCVVRVTNAGNIWAVQYGGMYESLPDWVRGRHLRWAGPIPEPSEGICSQ